MGKTLLLCTALALAGSGCDPGTDVADDDLPELADDGKADGVAQPAPGTYANPRGARLSLKMDRTYRLAEPTRVETGTYKFTVGGSSRYIKFAPHSGATPFRYAYTVAPGQLAMRELPSATWEDWDADSAACDVPADCELQNLSQPRCAYPPGGGWRCAESLCSFSCEASVVACGPVTCAAGEVCCNASCGICTAPGDFCTQQVCE
jgi:hypothetical protein